MRIRSTKPEFWRSKTIAALPWDVRLVLKGLESYVDDNGVGKDDIALIAADVFPRDLSANPPETLARLTEALSLLSDRGLIARYEHEGEDLVYIDRWKELQRIDKPTRGRFRRPDGTLDYGEDVARESYRRIPEKVAPGTGEQGNRGTGEQGNSVVADATTGDDARGDVERICEHLADRIEANGAKRPTITSKWRTAARLMLDRDGRTETEVVGAIDWCQADEFWRSNILSLPKFREKYDTLRLQAQRRNGTTRRGDIDWDAAMDRARQIDEANGAIQ